MIRLAVSSGFVAAIIVVIVIDLFAVFFGLSFLRTRREQRAQAQLASGGIVTEGVPDAPKPVSRRDFFRSSLLVSLTVFGVQFGAGTIAFLWPNLKGGFGSVIAAGNVSEIKSEINSTEQPFYVGAGRFYLVPYEGKSTGDVNYEAEGLAADGVMPLYQRCVHLGCRVPFCQSSQWFECPCHGSKYNEAGEYQLGPAPRGMDRFKLEIDGSGNVLVDTSVVILGPPRGTDTINEPPQGSFCVASG
ncbi:MAG: ubiquinol-cytochrome c reductase iron-sulfur subunit [Actinomycetota bacterium]